MSTVLKNIRPDPHSLIVFVLLFFTPSFFITLYMWTHPFEKDLSLKGGEIVLLTDAETPFLARLFRIVLDYNYLNLCINNNNSIPPDVSNINNEAGAINIDVFLGDRKIDSLYAKMGEVNKCKPVYTGSGAQFVPSVREVNDASSGEHYLNSEKSRAFFSEKSDFKNRFFGFIAVFLGWSASVLYIKKLYNFSFEIINHSA